MEAIRGDRTINEIGQQHGVHPNTRGAMEEGGGGEGSPPSLRAIAAPSRRRTAAGSACAGKSGG